MMAFPACFLSGPTVVLPGQRIGNDEVLREVRRNYKGPTKDLPFIEGVVSRVLRQCGSQYRHIEPDPSVRVADYASRAAKACLDENGVSADEIDLLINGGIAREYFEPATAMEIAANLGIEKVHALDVTSACAGQLEAIHIACSYLNMYGHMNTALVCSAELTREFLCYEIQSIEELESKLAGLTIGNAASAWLIRREPFSSGCVRLLGMRNFSLPQYWHLCQAPINGTFVANAGELFKLSVHVAPELGRMLEQVGWSPEEVDHFVFHQPSDKMIQKVLLELGTDRDKAVYCHHLFGNTASTTVSLAMRQLLLENELEAGEKLILSTAASGFTMVTAAGEWNV
jgi:3-oxoacyl-[acyl-carrier-protein] synthase-3